MWLSVLAQAFLIPIWPEQGDTLAQESLHHHAALISSTDPFPKSEWEPVATESWERLCVGTWYMSFLPASQLDFEITVTGEQAET